MGVRLCIKDTEAGVPSVTRARIPVRPQRRVGHASGNNKGVWRLAPTKPGDERFAFNGSADSSAHPVKPREHPQSTSELLRSYRSLTQSGAVRFIRSADPRAGAKPNIGHALALFPTPVNSTPREYLRAREGIASAISPFLS
jgi:hypothetical protein